MPSKSWRWIQLENPSHFSVSMKDPVDFAAWRITQNFQAGISECAFFRQTGRTHRLALRALDHAFKNETCIVFFSSRMWAQKFADLLIDWSDQIEMGFELRSWGGGKGFFLRSKNGGVVISVTHMTVFGLEADAMFRGTSYDYVYFDNEVLDLHLDFKKNASPLFYDIANNARHILTRKDRGRYTDGIIDIKSNLWRVGDLFTLPNLPAIGTVVDLNRVECIPISLTVLYSGDLIHMPWDACDVLLKTTDVS